MFSFLGLPTVFCFCCLANSVEWVEHKGLWYYISDGEMVDYTAATAKCDSINSHLAVITTEDQNEFIKSKTTDGIDRWIGLSNQESDHNSGPCELNSWFWNSDWNCSNDFDENVYIRSPALSECLAFTTNFGVWTLRYCTIKVGYICQWECKRFYLDLNYVDGNLSGIYEFYYYFNQHAVYTNSGSYKRIRIYKVLLGNNNNWVIHDDDWPGYWRAKSTGVSYVPYEHALAWTTIDGTGIISSTFCIECASLVICVSPPIPELKSHCVYLYLNYTIPEYVNRENNIVLKLHTKSQVCICMPTRDSCGQNCGYIFPYPNASTHVTLDNGENIILTSKCFVTDQHINTTESEYIKTTVEDKIQSTANAADGTRTPTATRLDLDNNLNNASVSDIGQQSSNLTTIIASVLPVVVIIIITILVIIIVVRIRRNKNRHPESNQRTEGNTNYPELTNTNPSNVYMRYEQPVSENTAEPVYTSLQANASSS